MTPGSPLVVHCPACDAKASKRTLASGNTFGAQQWTDLKMEAPMLPHYPDLARCSRCGSFFLFSQAREASEQPRGWDAPPDAPFAAEPSESEWLDALEQGVFDADSEEYGRLQAWHAANDVRRATPDASFEFSPAARANLEALSALLARKTNPEAHNDALLLRAEIARELGRFDEALALLNGITNEDYAMPRDRLSQLAQQGDAAVRLLSG